MERVQLLLEYLDRLIAMASLSGGIPEKWLDECVSAIREELKLTQPAGLNVSMLITTLQDQNVQDEVKRIIENAMKDALKPNG